MNEELLLEEASVVISDFKNLLFENAIATMVENGIDVEDNDIQIMDKYFDVVCEETIDRMIPDQSELTISDDDIMIVENSVYLKDGVDLAYICESADLKSELAEVDTISESTYDLDAILENINIGEK